MARRDTRFIIVYREAAARLLAEASPVEARPIATLLLGAGRDGTFTCNQRTLAATAGCSVAAAASALRLLRGKATQADAARRAAEAARAGWETTPTTGPAPRKLPCAPLAKCPIANQYAVSPWFACSGGAGARLGLREAYARIAPEGPGLDPKSEPGPFVRVYRRPARALLGGVGKSALVVAAWLALSMCARDNVVTDASASTIARETRMAAQTVRSALLELRGRPQKGGAVLDEPFLARMRGEGPRGHDAAMVNPAYACAAPEDAFDGLYAEFARRAQADSPARKAEEAPDGWVVSWDRGERLVRVVAGAGAGKTQLVADSVRGLAERLGDGELALCVTYTNTAADELRARIEGAGVPCRTVREAERDGEAGARALCGTIHSFVGHAVLGGKHGDAEWLLAEGVRLLCGRDGTRARGLARRFPYVFVDEFQDTSPEQARIVSALGAAGSRVCVVGDPAQAIYRFNGARAALFSTMSASRWGKRKGERNLTREVSMSENHRSSGRIVAVANALRADGVRQKAAARGEEPPVPGQPVTFLACGARERTRATREASAAGWAVVTRTWDQAYRDLDGVTAAQARELARMSGDGDRSLDLRLRERATLRSTLRLLLDLLRLAEGPRDADPTDETPFLDIFTGWANEVREQAKRALDAIHAAQPPKEAETRPQGGSDSTYEQLSPEDRERRAAEARVSQDEVEELIREWLASSDPSARESAPDGIGVMDGIAKSIATDLFAGCGEHATLGDVCARLVGLLKSDKGFEMAEWLDVGLSLVDAEGDVHRYVLATLDAMFRHDDGNVTKDGERLERLGWEVVRPALPMLLGDVPGGVTAHHSKGRQYARVIVDLRPARGESGVAEAFALPSAGGRLGDDFSNLLYVACTRARDRLCILVDDADETREAIVGALDADLARSGSSDDDAYRYVTPDELPEGFWDRGWDSDGD